MNSFVTKVQVLFLALLASVLSARGDIDALYTREELTDQMGAGWPETAKVFHWYRTENPQSSSQAWAIRFDLTDPHFRFTTRLGCENTKEGNSLASLDEMAGALKGGGRHPLAAINGGIAKTIADFEGPLMSDSMILKDVVKTRSDVLLTESSCHRFELRTGKSDRHGWPTDSKSQKVRNLAGWSKSLLRYENGSYVEAALDDRTQYDGYCHSLVGVDENAALGRRTLVFLVTRGDVTDHDAVAMLVTLGSKTVVENESGEKGVAAGLWVEGSHPGVSIPSSTTKLASGLVMTYEDPVEETVNIHDSTAGASVENDTYATLEEAMRAVTKEESIILTAPVEVQASCAASAGGTLTTYSMAEPGTAVTIADGVKMSVGGMTFEHVAFRAPDGSRGAVHVGAGRRLTVGLCVENLCVQTADRGGFCMSSNLTEEVVVDCLAATEEDPTFGTYNASLTEEELDASLPFVRHPTDPQKIATVSGNYLRWMTAAARVGEHVYGTLDDAIAAARRAGESPTVEVLCPIALEKSTAIDFDCTLTATNDDVMASAVLLKPGVTLSVGGDARVLFTNLAITNAARSAVIGIEPNGIAAVSGHVVVDRFETRKDEYDPSSTPPQGVFELAGELTEPVRLASVAGDTVGTVVGISSLPVAAAAAAKVVNANDDEQCAEAFQDGEEVVALRWRVAEVSDGDAVVRLKQGGTTTNYRSLRTLFRALSGDAEVIILKDCALTEPLTIAAGTEVKLVSDGEDPAVVSLPSSSSATAWVSVSGDLTLENVVFDGSSLGPKEKSAAVFSVVKNGHLTLGAQAGVQSVQLNSSSAGAVYVNKGGTLTMTDGSLISGITGGGSSSAAVYLASGAVFNAQGGRIVDCTQPKGGVRVYGATMNVSGSLTVQGNANSSGAVKNVTVENSGKLVLAGTLTGTVGVTFGNADGEAFGTVTAGGDSADHFICDVKPDGKTLRGTAAEGSLVWKAVVVVPPAMVRVNDSSTPYGTLQDAVDAAAAGDTLTILAPLAVSSMPVRIDKQLTLRAADPAFVVTRASPDRTNVNTVQRAIEVAADGVRFENIVLGDDADPWARAFVHVLPGATLTLGDGAVVRNVRGTFLQREGQKDPIGRSAAGILAEGMLVMESGSRIFNCTNDFNESAGGGVLVSGPQAFFDFRGGTVTGCSAHRGGGVFVEKQAGAAVCGAGQIIGNANGNLYIAAESPLKITGAFTGRIDHMDGVVRPDTETNLFAYVTYDYTGDLDALAAGAIRFTNELTRACGVAVTNGTGGASYLWNTALATRPDYEKGGESWAPIGEVPPQPVPVVTTEIDPPTAVEGLVYNGQEQKGVVPAIGYSVTGGAKVDAGDYTAIVTPWPNYVWSDDGTADPREIEWSIAKAAYDMGGVIFTNVTYVCDGAAKSNLVDTSTLPDGVSVTNYLNNGQTEVGVYTVTAQFGGDAGNYEPIADMTATLTITEAPTPPPGPTPHWEVETHHPDPIAFKSIERVSDTEWTLVVTDRVEYCNYRLIWTKDLAKGFTETGKWEHAVGPAAEPVWTTNVITTGGAWFWRAEGADGTNMVYKTEE